MSKSKARAKGNSSTGKKRKSAPTIVEKTRSGIRHDSGTPRKKTPKPNITTEGKPPRRRSIPKPTGTASTQPTGEPIARQTKSAPTSSHVKSVNIRSAMEHIVPTPDHRREATRAASIGKWDLDNLPTVGANGRFNINFVYNDMHFSVRVLAKNQRGARLYMEGHLGFVPFSYEGGHMREQLLEVLQLARRQKAVYINLVGEQRIALTAEIFLEGSLTPNSFVAAAASRIAAVKPLLDVIRTLQPYRRGHGAPTSTPSAA